MLEARTPDKEKMNPIPTVAAIITKNDRILLVTHGEKAGHITGIKGLPSGRVEEGETERETIIREIREETALEVNDDALSEFEGNYFEATILRKDGTEKTYGWRVFKVSEFAGEIEGNEETVPGWASLEEVERLDGERMLLPNVRTAIENSLKSHE